MKKESTLNKRRAGFTLVEIMIVVAIIGLLAAIAIPNFVRARTQSQMNACINNLRQIDGAIQQWALETKQAANAPVTQADVVPYLKSPAICPSAGAGASGLAGFQASYTLTTVSNAPTCAIAPATHILP
jgi:prepilin-type N-terminal cleavage/methylation domain-containing protein